VASASRARSLLEKTWQTHGVASGNGPPWNRRGAEAAIQLTDERPAQGGMLDAIGMLDTIRMLDAIGMRWPASTSIREISLPHSACPTTKSLRSQPHESSDNPSRILSHEPLPMSPFP
jgi:hypothetical protein